MDPESKEQLAQTLRLAEENNRMIRKMKRTLDWSRAMRFIYWIFIIGTALGAYYFVQPYVDQVKDLYGGAKSNIDNINSIFGGTKN